MCVQTKYRHSEKVLYLFPTNPISPVCTVRNRETVSHFQTPKYFRELSEDHRHNLEFLPEERRQTNLVQEQAGDKYGLSVQGMQNRQLFRNTEFTEPELLSHKSKRAKKSSTRNYLRGFGEVFSRDGWLLFIFSKWVTCQKYSFSLPESIQEFRKKIKKAELSNTNKIIFGECDISEITSFSLAREQMPRAEEDVERFEQGHLPPGDHPNHSLERHK